MDKFKTAPFVGGLPFTLDDFRWFFGRLTAPNEGIYQAFNNLLRGFGDNFIIQGCIVGGIPGARNMTSGWILLDGELIRVNVQPLFDEVTDNKFVKVTTFDSRGTKTFLNGSINETYEKNRAVIQGITGNLDFDADRFAELNIAETLSASSVVGTVRLKKKIVEIGDWNMDADISTFVDHGIADFSKIRTVLASIISDDGAVIQPLNKYSSSVPGIIGGVVVWTPTFIGLSRTVNEFFDSTSYDSTSFNRGHITIEYEA